MLGLGPLLDLIILTIQQTELPALEELWQEEEASWDTEECHEGEGNRDSLDIHHTKDTDKESYLEESVLVDAALFHVLCEDSLRVSAGLLEEEEESVPELDPREGRKTHKEEDSIKNWKWKQLKDSQEEHT